MTPEERAAAIEELQSSLSALEAAVAGLSEQQAAFRAGGWSVTDCVEHIYVVEKRSSAFLYKEPPALDPSPERAAETAGKDKLVRKGVLNRKIKVEAPEPMRPAGRFATVAEALDAVRELRSRLIALVAATSVPLRQLYQPHPFLGPLDGYQWVLFCVAHGLRHTAQLLEIKANPGFPA